MDKDTITIEELLKVLPLLTRQREIEIYRYNYPIQLYNNDVEYTITSTCPYTTIKYSIIN